MITRNLSIASLSIASRRDKVLRNKNKLLAIVHLPTPLTESADSWERFRRNRATLSPRKVLSLNEMQAKVAVREKKFHMRIHSSYWKISTFLTQFKSPSFTISSMVAPKTRAIITTMMMMIKRTFIRTEAMVQENSMIMTYTIPAKTARERAPVIRAHHHHHLKRAAKRMLPAQWQLVIVRRLSNELQLINKFKSSSKLTCQTTKTTKTTRTM